MGRRGGGIFAAFGNMLYEGALGRIHWRSNMWALVGSQWDRRRIQNKNMIGCKSLSVNAMGELIKGDHVLVSKLNTRCPNPPGSDFYHDEKGAWVPAVVCRKCEFHRKAGNRIRFPRCTYQKPKTEVEAATQAAVQTASILGDALKKAKEMIG